MKLTYNGGTTTIANWLVREPVSLRKAKNVLLFIGDGQSFSHDVPILLLIFLLGMTQPMITAARLIAHKSINGKYQSLMQMDQMDNLGQCVLTSTSLG